MKSLARKFYSKIILFGEYTVIHGGDLLSINYKGFGGRLTLQPEEIALTESAHRSNRVLHELSCFLEEAGMHNVLDIETLKRDIKNNLYFDSDIPEGYGLGSSGALMAALFYSYSREGVKDAGLHELREYFAKAESWFHGRSSGTDPLSSFMGTPLLFSGKQGIKKITLPESRKAPLHIFLLDTGTRATTGNLVNIFMDKYGKTGYSEKIKSELAPITTLCINEFLSGETHALLKSVKNLSALQFEMFREMIPISVIELWKKSLMNDSWIMKLCGSGGGGYLLVFTSLQDIRELEGFSLLKVL